MLYIIDMLNNTNTKNQQGENTMLYQTFIAKTKSGIEVILEAENTVTKLKTSFPVECVTAKEGCFYVIVLTPQETLELVGMERTAKVLLDNQAGWKQFELDCRKERYDTEQARPKSLEEQRKTLLSNEYNLYSAENFPGSRAWNKWNDAMKAIRAFDIVHPEIKANLKSVDNGFIPTEGGVNL